MMDSEERGKEFELSATSNRLERLDKPHRLMFALLCAERLLPGYQHFQKVAGWGDSTTLAECIDVGYASTVGAHGDIDIDSLITRCDRATPSSEEFDEVQVAHAQNCAIAVTYALMVLHGDAINAAYSAQKVVETIDSYLTLSMGLGRGLWDPSNQQRIDTHELMQRELAKQEADIVKLSNMVSLNQHTVDAMRNENLRFSIPFIP